MVIVARVPRAANASAPFLLRARPIIRNAIACRAAIRPRVLKSRPLTISSGHARHADNSGK